ncbi:DUF4363 family protein [Virgibacillus siamensis]|uniref:DUF4363 family protein n=1 Tax=Virgibacillus siamensis TaxID=480071 RepID=UPI001FEA7AAE|nr:DUF4363 family protein [Virgibacillus siamensis]
MIVVFLGVCMILLTGCQSEKAFFHEMQDINKTVEQKDWDQAKANVKKLSQLYKKEKWKLQLLGDEAEYEGINVELQVLKESVQAKDKTQTKVSLGTIRGHLKDIYSF